MISLPLWLVIVGGASLVALVGGAVYLLYQLSKINWYKG